MVHNGKKKNPLHVSLAELFHDKSRSKLIIDILNKLGLCISYEEVRRIDFGLANRIINAWGSNRVPVPLSIEDGVVDDVVNHLPLSRSFFDWNRNWASIPIFFRSKKSFRSLHFFCN